MVELLVVFAICEEVVGLDRVMGSVFHRLFTAPRGQSLESIGQKQRPGQPHDDSDNEH